MPKTLRTPNSSNRQLEFKLSSYWFLAIARNKIVRTKQQETFFIVNENAKHLTHTDTDAQTHTDTHTHSPDSSYYTFKRKVSKASVFFPPHWLQNWSFCAWREMERTVRWLIKEQYGRHLTPHQGNVTSRLRKRLPCSLDSRPDRTVLGLPQCPGGLCPGRG